MRIDIVTIFPQMFESPLGETIIKRAVAKERVEIHRHDIRAHAHDKHHCVDDTPYGGGAGMVMIAGPITEAVEAVPRVGRSVSILLTPQGEPFTQAIARELAVLDQVILICGRYEGIDERARRIIAERELSIGDYVLSGGEIPAMVVTDAIVRLLPGVLGNEASIEHESHEAVLLEHPQYTRPEHFRGEGVPKVLLSGNHADIERWRRGQMLLRTKLRRPELLERLVLTEEDRELLREAESAE